MKISIRWNFLETNEKIGPDGILKISNSFCHSAHNGKKNMDSDRNVYGK